MIPFHTMQAAPFLLAALAAAFLALPRAKSDPEDWRGLAVRVFAYWAISILLLFTISARFIPLVALGLVALALAPKAPAQKIAFYIGVVFAVPSEYQEYVPFPGVNYLIILNHAKVLALVLLLPLCVGGGKAAASPSARGRRRENGIWRKADILFGIWIAIVAILDLRMTQTFTNSLRHFADIGLELVLPYLAVRRSVRSMNDIQIVLWGLLLGLLILTALGLLSGLQNWLHYKPLGDNALGWTGAFRGGGVRVNVTLSSILLGQLMVVCMALLFWRRRVADQPWLPLMWLLPCAFVLEATGSRGAILAAIVAVGGLVYFRTRAAGTRTFIGVGGASLLAITYMTLQSTGFDAVDEYGTFDYRQQLLETAAVKIRQVPLLGDADYYDDPLFEPLRQGQGIIDFVNGYVQVALGYGLLGLGLLLASLAAAFFGTAKGTYVLMRQNRTHGEPGAGFALGIALSSLGVMLMTVSFVSYIELFLILLIALNVCYTQAALTEKRKAEPSLNPTEAGEPPAPSRRPLAAEAEREPASVSPWPQGYTPGRTGWPS
ncbi:O-antigen ligase family protein [Parvularcula oceani]|uniref:O-antigen ligase family protein n=1 Tax=Parvularcula oceani TaxID=1247963 RepID=UPI0004E13931|nr:O-antigen ligase family protein [Parvularcula oceani]